MSDNTAVLEHVKESEAFEAQPTTRAILSGPAEDTPDQPFWFRQQREQGWQDFSLLPNPTRKDQPWRFSNVDMLNLASYQSGNPPSDYDRAETLLAGDAPPLGTQVVAVHVDQSLPGEVP